MRCCVRPVHDVCSVIGSNSLGTMGVGILLSLSNMDFECCSKQIFFCSLVHH